MSHSAVREPTRPIKTSLGKQVDPGFGVKWSGFGGPFLHTCVIALSHTVFYISKLLCRDKSQLV